MNDYEKVAEKCRELALEVDGMDNPGDEELEIQLSQSAMHLIKCAERADRLS